MSFPKIRIFVSTFVILSIEPIILICLSALHELNGVSDILCSIRGIWPHNDQDVNLIPLFCSKFTDRSCFYFNDDITYNSIHRQTKYSFMQFIYLSICRLRLWDEYSSSVTHGRSPFDIPATHHPWVNGNNYIRLGGARLLIRHIEVVLAT